MVFSTTNQRLDQPERLIIVLFLVTFPILVFCVFTYLVIRHNQKLFSPSDFKDEKNWMESQIRATVALTAASTKKADGGVEDETILAGISKALHVGGEVKSKLQSTRRGLWVDDRPENNRYEMSALQEFGVTFDLSMNTTDALHRLSQESYAIVISDMARREGPREGYCLLDAMRKKGDQTPLIFYAKSKRPEYVKETYEHGGQGYTNIPSELFTLVMQNLR